MTDTTFEIALEGCGFRLPLNWEALSEAIGSVIDLPMTPEIEGFLMCVATHPVTSIRSKLASFLSDLPIAIYARLAADPDPSVLLELAKHPSSMKKLEAAAVLRVVASSVDAAKNVAENVEILRCRKEVRQVLLTHPDPEVREALANNPEIPKSLRRKLASDPVAAVREAAIDWSSHDD